nr:MAG TPA: hypothetical protein [Caudoviricetes sp.]DAZ34928.1 MAG TPA: hypothetical protein [Caudoviricetes sp.]
MAACLIKKTEYNFISYRTLYAFFFIAKNKI